MLCRRRNWIESGFRLCSAEAESRKAKSDLTSNVLSPVNSRRGSFRRRVRATTKPCRGNVSAFQCPAHALLPASKHQCLGMLPESVHLARILYGRFLWFATEQHISMVVSSGSRLLSVHTCMSAKKPRSAACSAGMHSSWHIYLRADSQNERGPDCWQADCAGKRTHTPLLARAVAPPTAPCSCSGG